MTTARKLSAAALATAGVLSLAVAGCSAKSDNAATGANATKDAAKNTTAAASAPSMSAADLQTSLAARISASTPPQSVTCSGDLPGEVGKTTSCEVTVNDTTSVQANITVTKVDGTNIDYAFEPAMTKEQLEKAFAANVSADVTCDAGLDGEVGASTTCNVTKDGTTDTTTVSVSKVQGLYMSLATSPSS